MGRKVLWIHVEILTWATDADLVRRKCVRAIQSHRLNISCSQMVWVSNFTGDRDGYVREWNTKFPYNYQAKMRHKVTLRLCIIWCYSVHPSLSFWGLPTLVLG